MNDRWAIAAVISCGFLFTAVNGVSGYRGARRRLHAASDRIMSSKRFSAEEAGAAHGSSLDTAVNDAALSAHEVLDVLNGVLRSSRTGLLLAGFGLLLSTLGALWSVFA